MPFQPVHDQIWWPGADSGADGTRKRRDNGKAEIVTIA
jgi:hypothetical protein